MMTKRLKGRLLCVGLCLAASMSCVKAGVETGPRPDATIRIQLSDGTVERLPMEDYVAGSLLAETALNGLDAATARRVAEVQAVVIRTYAVANQGRHDHEGFSLCSTTHCQVYRSLADQPADRAALAIEAARSTRGQVLTYGGHPINAVYHAHCGGRTSDATVPWGGRTPPYLRSVDDPFCVKDDPSTWRFEASRQELLDALNRDSRTAPGGSLSGITVVDQDRSGRAITVRLSGDTTREVRGEIFRSVLAAAFGPLSLRSTRFSVSQTSDHLVFQGQGLGHGVGLCQRGTLVRAREGHRPLEILSHYYPDTVLARYY